MKMAYQDIQTSTGYRHVTEHGEAFLSFEQMNLTKQLWRMSDLWHPVDSLFDVIPILEKHFVTNVIRITEMNGTGIQGTEEAVQVLGNLIMAGTVR